MPSVALTDAFIRSLTPNPQRQFEKFDSRVPGFGVRVSPGGTVSFFVMYRIGGLNRRLTLGRYDAISLKEARSSARDVLSEVRRGIDPAAEKKRARNDYQHRLFPKVLDDFIENHAKRKTRTRSWKETNRILRSEFVKLWRRLRIEQITKQHVNKVLDAIVKRGTPSAANHAFSAIRKFFNWCVERDYLEHSPCSGMTKPYKDVSRDRVLSDDDLARVWFAAHKMAWPFGPFVQLLILTLQRRSEVAGMRWEELDSLKGFWELPPGDEERIHKSDRRHFVPLSTPVLDALKTLPRIHDELVFPAKGKDNPISGFSKWKNKLDELSGVRNWRLHDLRRTAGSAMGDLGVAPHVIDLIQNHRTPTLKGITGIYNKSTYWKERKEALELWARHLKGLLENAQKTSGTAYQAHENDTGLAYRLR